MKGTKSSGQEVEVTDVFVNSRVTQKRYSFMNELKKTSSDSKKVCST